MLLAVCIKKMKDKGIVISTRRAQAQVKVACLEACDDCAVHSLCIGNQQDKGLVSVQNALQAQPGDEVLIEVPDGFYNKALILLFGGMLGAGLLGMMAGYMLAASLSWSANQAALIGFFLGIGTAAFVLFRYFRRSDNTRLYPIIIDITKKGDCHG